MDRYRIVSECRLLDSGRYLAPGVEVVVDSAIGERLVAAGCAVRLGRPAPAMPPAGPPGPSPEGDAAPAATPGEGPPSPPTPEGEASPAATPPAPQPKRKLARKAI